MNGINKFRLVLLFLIFFMFYLIGLINLFIIQIKKSTFYENVGKQQYHFTIKQAPDRAPIYDRNGQPLALNKQVFSAFIIPNQLTEKKQLELFLKDYFPQAYQQLKKKEHKQFMYLKRQLTSQELELIHQAHLPDIQLLKEPSRFYPVPSLGHTIGITDIDNKGLTGIELICNKQLAGQPTTYHLEKDARSNHFYFKKETTIQGIEGTPIHLTLDSDLQFFAYDELKEHITNLNAQEGSVLIMDPQNGDILAMACYPDFNPNKIPPHNLWLTKNRIITEVHEPGSVMKIFPALAALEEEVVTPNEIIDCENKKETTLNGIKFSTWKACGPLSYTEVIRYSNNIGTAKVSLRLGKKLYHNLRKCGFGLPTGLNFLGEQSGFITPPNKWSRATPISLSFGYEISATPLQIACGFALLANEGKTIQPRLFLNSEKNQFDQQSPLYSPQTIEQVREIIALDHEGNTARRGRITGFNVMGKTGTAYVITNGTYDKHRSIYTFAGIIEKGTYKRIMVTFIREPEPQGRPLYASTVAVPLFTRIAQSMLIHDKVI